MNQNSYKDLVVWQKAKIIAGSCEHLMFTESKS